MSAVLPSSCFQPVASRHQLGLAVGGVSIGDGLSPAEMGVSGPVTDRHQFEPVTSCDQLDHRRVLTAVGLVVPMLISACHGPRPVKTSPPEEIHTADYDLIMPAEQKALLVLFPCFSCDAADTRAGSRIADTAAANGIAVLMMDFNRHIMMTEAEKQEVIGTIASAVKEHDVDASNTFIGGFSSGGNVSVLLAKVLLRSADPPVKLKGVFAVDSPLDLALLYACSQRDLAKTTFPEHKDEARYVVAFLDSTLGSPTDSLGNYERSAPLLNTAASVAPLKDLPVRFYTEPDTAWWRANRDDGYEELNAFGLKRINDTLQAAGNARSEYITTEGRGIQHGERHPHAWSIVDEKDLVAWIKRLSFPPSRTNFVPLR